MEIQTPFVSREGYTILPFVATEKELDIIQKKFEEKLHPWNYSITPGYGVHRDRSFSGLYSVHINENKPEQKFQEERAKLILALCANIYT